MGSFVKVQLRPTQGWEETLVPWKHIEHKSNSYTRETFITVAEVSLIVYSAFRRAFVQHGSVRFHVVV